MRQRGVVRLSRDSRVLQNRFDFGGENETPASPRKKKRLDPGPVAREQQPAARDIPNSDGEHAIELMEKVVAILFVEMDQNLRVGMVGPKCVPLRSQLRLKLGIVIDFAVEDDAYGIVFIEDGLLSRLQIDDRQTAHSEGDVGALPMPRLIRTAMRNEVRHALQNSPVRVSREAANSAHAKPSASVADADGGRSEVVVGTQSAELHLPVGLGVLYDFPVVMLPGAVLPIGADRAKRDVVAAAGQMLVAIETEAFAMPDIANGLGSTLPMLVLAEIS